jgi:uncharacterized spore protein YtfJ
MLKLFENRVVNTMNKLAVSIEDIKGGRFEGEDKGRDGTGGGGGGGAGMTHDVMSVLTEQHNRLMLALAAQTQKLEAHTQQLDKLEHVCLHRTRSDEHRECSDGGEPPRSEFAPKIEEILQTVGDLKERLADAEAEVLDLQDDLEEEKSRVEELQGKLRSAQQALDEGARERCYLGNDLVLAHLRKHTLYHQPFSAEATNGMREGTPTVLHMQAEPVQTSNHARGRGRDTERPHVSSSRARSSPSLRSHMTDQPRSEQHNRIFQDIDLFRPDKYNQLMQDINRFLKPEADEGGGRCAGVHGVRSGADKTSPERFARKSSKDFPIEISSFNSSAKRSDCTPGGERQATQVALRTLRESIESKDKGQWVKESGGSTETRESAGKRSSGVGGRGISPEAKLVRGAPLTRYQPVAPFEASLLADVVTFHGDSLQAARRQTTSYAYPRRPATAWRFSGGSSVTSHTKSSPGPSPTEKGRPDGGAKTKVPPWHFRLIRD